jgi:hypothetical protein
VSERAIRSPTNPDHKQRHATGRVAPQQDEKGTAMSRKTIDYARLGAEACEAFTEGPAASADFVRTILSIAAPLHLLQTTTTEKLTERLNSFSLCETKH